MAATQSSSTDLAVGDSAPWPAHTMTIRPNSTPARAQRIALILPMVSKIRTVARTATIAADAPDATPRPPPLGRRGPPVPGASPAARPAAPRDLPAQPESVQRVVDRLGSVQFDPLEVPGARNHDLVLHARIAGYRRDWCDKWLYTPPEERRLIELYNKSLNILPMAELPYFRFAWERWRDELESGVLQEHAELVATILERIEREGPLSTDAFRHIDHRIEWWWDATGTTT